MILWIDNNFTDIFFKISNFHGRWKKSRFFFQDRRTCNTFTDGNELILKDEKISSVRSLNKRKRLRGSTQAEELKGTWGNPSLIMKISLCGHRGKWDDLRAGINSLQCMLSPFFPGFIFCFSLESQVSFASLLLFTSNRLSLIPVPFYSLFLIRHLYGFIFEPLQTSAHMLVATLWDILWPPYQKCSPLLIFIPSFIASLSFSSHLTRYTGLP